MKELLKKNAKITGILLGLLIGALQGLDMESMKEFSRLNEGHLVMFIAFGLFAPPLIGFMNSMPWLSSRKNILDRVDEYMSLYFFMFAGSLTLGISGWITLQNKGISDGTNIVCAFFAAAGIGFLLAYFVNRHFQREVHDNA